VPVLTAFGISKAFGATVALAGVDLQANAGEVRGIVGENGSGKSTLMKIVAGVIQPDGGHIEIDGEPFRPKSPLDARRAGIAMIHQELSICSDLTVAENIALGAEPNRAGVLSLSEMRQTAKTALAALGHGDLDVETKAKRLSIATQQIVEIARAVSQEARIIILDEPTSSLSEADVKHLFSAVVKLKERGAAVLYISHFLNEIRELCDTLTVLRDGQFVGNRSVDKITDPEIVQLMVGRSIEELYPRSPRHPGDVILSLKDLSGRLKPKDASLEVRRGEVVGIAGLNGSGRTELMRLICGLDQIRQGQITIGSITGPASVSRRWDEGVGLLSENRKEEGLFLNLSIAENVTMASLSSFFVSPQTQATQSQTWIGRLGVKCRGPEQAVGELSGGNQQKVALARMLHHNVDLLLLDEPTRGIDVGSKEQIYRLIDDLAVSGKAVLIVSSYLPELLGICDRIAVMSRGRLSAPLAAAEATQESLMQLAVQA
jgi:ribose transport system ATP-binding protein